MGWTFYNSSGQRLTAPSATIPDQATQAEAEAESNVNKYIPPDLIKNSPGVAKAWCSIAANGSLESGDYNVDSVTDTGTGNRTIVWGTDFSSSIYVVTTGMRKDVNDFRILKFANPLAVGSAQFDVINNAASASVDIGSMHAAFGDQ
jgi:hypothetical protein